MAYIVTISPQGQITIPGVVRKTIKARKFCLDVHGQKLVLKPARIFVEKEVGLKELKAKLSKVEWLIYSIIRENPCSGDELFCKAAIDVPLLMQTLAMLEIKSLIKKDGWNWKCC